MHDTTLIFLTARPTHKFPYKLSKAAYPPFFPEPLPPRVPPNGGTVHPWRNSKLSPPLTVSSIFE
jgi:hypothetical protein